MPPRRIGARPRRSSPPNLGRLDEVAARYRMPRQDRYNFVVDVVEAWARAEPDALAMIVADLDRGRAEHLSIGDVAALARRAARVLRARGVRHGDVLLLACSGRPVDWHGVKLGAWRIGAVPFLLD